MEDSNPNSNPVSRPDGSPADSNPLDSYSQIVSGVAERLTPKVASLRVPRVGQGAGYGRGESLGSGVVFTGDGFLLTNAHVVGKSTTGTAEFADGTSAPFRAVGAGPVSDPAGMHAAAGGPYPGWWAPPRCPPWRCGAPTARPRSPPSSARLTRSGSASWW